MIPAGHHLHLGGIDAPRTQDVNGLRERGVWEAMVVLDAAVALFFHIRDKDQPAFSVALHDGNARVVGTGRNSKHKHGVPAVQPRAEPLRRLAPRCTLYVRQPKRGAGPAQQGMNATTERRDHGNATSPFATSGQCDGTIRSRGWVRQASWSRPRVAAYVE